MSCGAGGGLAAPPRSCTHICSTGFQVKTGASCRPTTSITARLTGMLARLTRSWVAVGTQSVGGGTSTLLLIRRLAVDRERWMSAREFTEYWALSQLSPGIHLVALAGLIGNRIAGWRGVLVSVAGMMVPAAAGTIMPATETRTPRHPAMRFPMRPASATRWMPGESCERAQYSVNSR